MNPQYYPQPQAPQQYGGAQYGGPQYGGGPPPPNPQPQQQVSAPRGHPPPSQPQMGPPPQNPGNRPMGQPQPAAQQNGPYYQPPQQNGPPPQQPGKFQPMGGQLPQPGQLANQMAGMSIGGNGPISGYQPPPTSKPGFNQTASAPHPPQMNGPPPPQPQQPYPTSMNGHPKSSAFATQSAAPTMTTQSPMGGPRMGFPPGFPNQQPGFPNAQNQPPSSGANQYGGQPPSSVANAGFPQIPPSSVANSGFPHMQSQPPSSVPNSGFQPMQNQPPSSVANSGFPPMPNQPPSSVANSGFPPPQQPQYMNGPKMSAPPQGYQQAGPPPPNYQGPPQPGYQPGPPAPQPGYPTYQGYSGGDPRGQPQQQPMASPFPGAQSSGQMAPGQAQGQRRLDPDQMPSPIQVMDDDHRSRSGEFITGTKGQLPPLVTTKFVTRDNGVSGPSFIRATMYSVPSTPEMMKQTSVPFGLVISPLAECRDTESPVPVVDLGEMGPVRCIRCKAYMCPFMQFVDGGRRFQCVFCKATAEVPPEYFQHLDHTGQRMDKFERPELCLGTYEYVATKDYCRDNIPPKPPAFIFVIDVSYTNLKSGLVQLLCSRMREVLRELPRESGQDKSAVKVGFITYGASVHFYNVKGCLSQPQMLVVSDVADVFMPLLDGFLCDPEESEQVLDALMEQIPKMFQTTHETEVVLGSAIQAGLEALKASECSGKLLVFHSSLPTSDAPGRLKTRDDRKLLATDKEKTLLCPQSTFYTQLGQDCVASGCCIDLFIFNNAYVDLATIGQVAKLTGGQVYKYTYFQADLDGDRFIQDLCNGVSKSVAFDSIMRVRTSTGVRATDFYGGFFMSNTTDMELAGVDSGKAVAVEIKHDDKLTEEDGVYVQVALLYTSCGGQRRLRVLNLALNTCVQMADLFRNCELDTIINFFGKQAMVRLLEQTPQTVKEGLITRCAQMLACYRKHCASPSSAGQLILPECLKLLPLYINCLLKSDCVSGGADMATDDRSYLMQSVLGMDVASSVGYFYPRLMPVLDWDGGNGDEDSLPPPVRCSVEKLREDAVFLLENGVYMFVWIGMKVPPEWLQGVFGVASVAQVDIDRTSLPEIDSKQSIAIRELVRRVRAQRHRHMRLTLVRQHDKMEFVLRHFLVEDRGSDTSPSYVDFLCHMHKEIRGLLT